MTALHLEIDVDSTAEKVFDAIVDLRGYGRWLASSASYPGTTEISSDPVAAGTT